MLKLRGKKAKVVKHLIGWLDGFYFFFFCTSLFPRISQHCACIFWDHEGGRAEQKSTETQPLPFEKKLICFTKQLRLIYLWATFGYYITFFKKTSAFLIFFYFRTAVLWSPLRGATFFFFFGFCKDIPEHNRAKCFPCGAPACCWYESKWFSFRSNPPQFNKGGIYALRVESAGLWHNRPWIAFWSPSRSRFWQKNSAFGKMRGRLVTFILRHIVLQWNQKAFAIVLM